MDVQDAETEDRYDPQSPEVGSEVGEYEFDYEQPEDVQRNEANYDWSARVNPEAAHALPDETPLSTPMTSPTIPKIAEKGTGPYFCDLCNKTFTNYGSYRRHLRMHYCEKKYTCHLCGRQFFRRYLWVKHQEKIHGNDPSSCRCPHCGDWSQSPDALREHLRTQHKRTNGCKENWTKEQGSPCKQPSSPATASTPAKKPRKKRTPKGVGVKEKRKKKTAPVVIKEEVFSDTPVAALDDAATIGEERDADLGRDTHPENESISILEDNPEYDSSINNGDVDFDGSKEDDGPLSPRNTSRYGRKRKQRVLFNTDTYPTSLKRLKRPSISSPSHRKSMDDSNSNGFKDDMEENRQIFDDPEKVEEIGATDISTELVEAKEEPVEESELSKLLQQALPSNGNMPKNVSHRGNFFCDKCRRFFINRSSYMRHRKMHTGVKPFTCEYCCLSFFRSESLTNHKKKHAKEDFLEFRCHLCGYKAANCASLRNHFHTVCSREKPEETKSRSAEFQAGNIRESAEGKNASRNIAGYCSLCNRAFFNLSNYQRHAKLHSSMASTVPMALTYTCSFCGKIFTNRAQYDGHVLAHSKEENVNEYISENGVPTSLEVLKLFGTFIEQRPDSDSEATVRIKEEPQDLEAGYSGANVDSNDNPRVMCCRMCPLAFTDRKTFLQHQKSHRGGELSYSCYCRYCGHPHKSKSEVAIHESLCFESRKAENRLHHCYNCEVKFDNGSALREHVKAAHSNDRIELARRDSSESANSEKNDAIADDFSIKRNDSLKFVENDEKNAGKYKCGKCDETFSDIQSVVSHIQKGHEESQPRKEKDGPRNEKRIWEINGDTSTSIMKQLLSSPPASSSRYSSLVNSANKTSHSRSFTCSLCLKAFDDPRVAEAHEQQAHVMVDWFQCALCEKTGGKKAMLSHMATHMIKIGSVVTTRGGDQDTDSDGDTLDLGKVPFPDRTRAGRRPDFKTPARKHQVPPRDATNPSPQFVSMFCQLCKKVISSLATLERHRHASQDPNVAFPYVCCMPGCGKCFALKVEALAHLQTLHKGSLTPSLTSNVAQKPSSPKTTTAAQSDNPKNRWLLGNSWKGLLAGGVGPFSQSLVQLSMAVAGNDPEATRSNVAGKRDENLIDIYQADALENLTSNGELTITKVGDVEEITVEPLLDCVLGEEVDNNETEDASPDAEESVVIPLSPTMVHEDLEEGEIPEPEATPPPKDPRTNKVLLQCEDCQSVFTNPCSWKRHRKLHLGIMKHKCTFCPRKFYRKDHCDKHVKTHENCNLPRRRKSPINIKIEPGAS